MEENSIPRLIAEVRSMREGFSEQIRGYAPIFNSITMLDQIERYFESNNQNLTDDQLDKVNIGLLAAKALDFEPDFYHYATSLHNLWQAFLRFCGQPFLVPTTGARKIVYDFYARHGYALTRIAAHMQGINFNKPVNITQLTRKQQVAQWRASTIAQGDYYCELRSQHHLTCQIPSCLGVYSKQQDRNSQQILPRLEQTLTLQANVAVLEAIAASVLDIWSINGQPFPAGGGCTQYFNANDKGQFV